MSVKIAAITAHDLVATLNDVVAREVERIDPTEWDEDHISFSLVRAVRAALAAAGRVHTGPSDHPVHLHAEAYKATGALEKTHGDIAIAVTNARCGLTGLGFYEAKAADQEGRYPAFKMRQLRRLTSSTPRLSVLLYERKDRRVEDDDLAFRELSRSSSRVRVLGANLASRFPEPGFPFLHPQSFGYHLVARYLSGRDLDYSREPAVALRRWLAATKRAPPLLVSVTISETQAPRPLPILAEYESLPPINVSLQLEAKRTPLLR